VVMRALFDGEGIHPSQLATTIGLTRGAVSKLIERLVAKGLAKCRSEKEDRRYQVVMLTTQGRELVPQLAQLADDNDHEFFGHLSQQESAILMELLKSICRRHGFKDLPVE
jgi:DNA-binding MarR family transcriptional regulator